MSNEFRRCNVDLLTPEERKIHDAIVSVESLGADVKLREIVSTLANAKNLLADYIEGK